MKYIDKLVVALFLVGVVSCGDQELTTLERLNKDIGIIDKYLADNSITAQTDPSGIRYVIKTEGTGVKPTLSSTISVYYTGTLLDGTKFDGTDKVNDPPSSFKLSQLIAGWQIVFPLIKQGSTFDMYIPSGLGYGKQGNSVIPANSILVFKDVELVEVK